MKVTFTIEKNKIKKYHLHRNMQSIFRREMILCFETTNHKMKKVKQMFDLTSFHYIAFRGVMQKLQSGASTLT